MSDVPPVFAIVEPPVPDVPDVPPLLRVVVVVAPDPVPRVVVVVEPRAVVVVDPGAVVEDRGAVVDVDDDDGAVVVAWFVVIDGAGRPVVVVVVDAGFVVVVDFAVVVVLPDGAGFDTSGPESSRSPGRNTARATPASSTRSAKTSSGTVRDGLGEVVGCTVRSPGLLERATGIEPAWSAWKADALPLSYARRSSRR